MSIQTKTLAKTLLEQHTAIALAYREGYDAVKYNFKVPLSDEKFETHKNKWHYVELAKHFESNKQALITEQTFPIFCTFMLGEGYRESDPYNITYINDIRSSIGLASIFSPWNAEQRTRYDHLHISLEHFRRNHGVNTLSRFKEMITVVGKSEPPMWNTIGYAPLYRANRTYSFSLQSFFLFDSYLHLLDKWDDQLKGEPAWDAHVRRLKAYRRLYTHFYPISSIKVRQTINDTMNFP